MRAQGRILVAVAAVGFIGWCGTAEAKPPFGIPGGGKFNSGAINRAIGGAIPGGARDLIMPGNLIGGRLGPLINSVAGRSLTYMRPGLMNSGYTTPYYLYPVAGPNGQSPLLSQRSIRGYGYSQLSGAPPPGTPATVPSPVVAPTPEPPPGSVAEPARVPPPPGQIREQGLTDEAQAALDFASQGEAEFRAGNYKAATRLWRHALLDSPQNGVLLLLVAQGQFAQGQYSESAMSTYDAIETLPPEHWGVVMENYKSLYPNGQMYTNQLRALEKKATESAEDPVLRFLIGYHYGYIGYPKYAVQSLDRVLPLIPDDALAFSLRNSMAVKAGLPVVERAPKGAE